MSDHPIQGLMSTAMQSIKEMIDVNTIVGDAVEAADGTIIIPISKVSFGFAAGGSEFELTKDKKEDSPKNLFAGGSGAGVTISPVAFMVVGNGNIRLLPVNANSSIERLLDFVPEVIDKIYNAINKKSQSHTTISKKPETVSE